MRYRYRSSLEAPSAARFSSASSLATAGIDRAFAHSYHNIVVCAEIGFKKQQKMSKDKKVDVEKYITALYGAREDIREFINDSNTNPIMVRLFCGATGVGMAWRRGY